jgi:guanylate kinase
LTDHGRLRTAGKLFVISGPSGAGKGTLIAGALRASDRFAVAVSATTRPRRPGEEHGREYLFLTDAQFQDLVDRGEFVEHVSFAGGRYGTLFGEVERLLDAGKAVILELEIEGAFAIRRRIPHAVLIFIDPPDFETLERRLRDRATDSAGEIDTRLEIAREQLQTREEFDHVIVNDDVERATAELLATLQGELEEGLHA